MADDEAPTITLYLSLTSSPSTPRIPLPLASKNGTATTAAELRRMASSATSVPLPSLKLIFRGRVIPDKDSGDVASEFKLEEGSVVHVMGRPVVASSSSSVASSSAGGAASVARTAATTMTTTAGAAVTLPTSTSGTATAASSSSSSPLEAAVAKLRSSNDGTAYRTALATADKLLGNVVSHPMEEKYRAIKRSNPAFSKRLGSVPGGSELLLASGFVLDVDGGTGSGSGGGGGVEYYVLRPSPDAWPRLVGAREEVRRLLEEFDREGRDNAAAAAPAMPPPPAAGTAGNAAFPGGMANLFPGGVPGGGGGGGGGMPDMAAVQSMMSDPNMMQTVMNSLNNPMVQNMMRNDPRLANNPMLQQSLDALRNNPEMISQFSQMMGDPNVRDRMSDMMSQQQQQSQPPAGGGTSAGGANDPFGNGPEAMRRQMEQFQRMSQQFGGSSGGFNAGGGGSGSGGTSGGGSANANAGGGGGVSGSTDGEMTEEEMIAEAIARSLRES